jgi:AraC-like DNA-binding protein
MTDSKLNSSNNHKDKKAVKKLYVKYMVCLRDKMLVQSVLEKQELNYKFSIHGAIELYEEVTNVQYQELKMGLLKSGLKLIDEKESMLIDRIINTIIEVIHYTDALPKLNFTDIISEIAGSTSDSILKIFSDVKGMSVLQFIVIQKIERAKELMLYDDMPLSEIAEILNYKNEHYMFAQFMNVTGLSPAYFKRLKNERMKIAEQRVNTFPTGATSE